MIKNVRNQTKQRILSKLTFGFAIMLLLSPATTAQQLAPNPNPVNNTFTLTPYADNFVYFDNVGTIGNGHWRSVMTHPCIFLGPETGVFNTAK